MEYGGEGGLGLGVGESERLCFRRGVKWLGKHEKEEELTDFPAKLNRKIWGARVKMCVCVCVRV